MTMENTLPEVISESSPPFGLKTEKIQTFSAFQTCPKLDYQKKNVRLYFNRHYFRDIHPERAKVSPGIDDSGQSILIVRLGYQIQNSPGIIPTLSANGHVIHFFPDRIAITKGDQEVVSFPITPQSALSVSQFLAQTRTGATVP